MRCGDCGAYQEHEGQAHDCWALSRPDTRPPAGWQAATWSVMGLAAAFALASLLSAIMIPVLYVLASRGGSDGLMTTLRYSAVGVTVLLVVTFVSHGVAFLVWRSSSRRLVAAANGDERLARHWAVTAWATIFWASLAATLLLQHAAPSTALLVGLLIHLVVRPVGAVLLIVGALIVRGRVLRLLAEPAAPAELGWSGQLGAVPQISMGSPVVLAGVTPQPAGSDAGDRNRQP